MKLITCNNIGRDNTKLRKIIGYFKPGYLYGTVKIHKSNPSQRPIISQVPTPIYEFTIIIK